MIADSGPQVTTKVKEDCKSEESENTHRKNSGDVDNHPKGYAPIGHAQVVSEKTETHESMKEAKEENLQYHDESLKELTGMEVHRRALRAPNELISLDQSDDSDRPKGKLVHYTSKTQKINDKEEINEVSKLGRDGNLTTETTRTHHHEEVDDDELPENQEALPPAPIEPWRQIEYRKDYHDHESSLRKHKAVEANYEEKNGDDNDVTTK